MRLFRPGFFARHLYPEALFRVKTKEKVLYLTFDDGPDPDSTPLLLSILADNRIKALFFCTGDAAQRHPDLIEKIVSYGHLIGNHSYSHLKGLITPTSEYLDDVEKAAGFTSSVLFRPPYGSITPIQFFKLRRQYKIVFWDIMPYDFDVCFGSKNSLRVLNRMIRPGSLIVLHDRQGSNALSFIEDFIALAGTLGYRFGEPEDLKS
jgi:peptidoglycan-N-acetylglucosamine deacetylase